MKILIATGLYPPDIGGPATYSKLLFEEMPKHSIDVEVLSFGEVRHLPKIVRHVRYIMMLLSRSRDVDVLYAQDPVSVGLPVMIASFLVRKPYVLKVVGDYAWEQYVVTKSAEEDVKEKMQSIEDFQSTKQGVVSEGRKKIERLVARKADRVIVPSEYLKSVVRLWGVDEKNISIVYNAFAPIRVDMDKESLRGEMGLSGDIIFTAGRLVPWKGMRDIITLLPAILQEAPNAKLYIAGTGPQEHVLKMLVENMGIESKVIFLGRLEKSVLARYLRVADVFVLHTFYEGFSHQILEAMSIGTPVVTTRVGGNPEVIENGKEGILVPYGESDVLKEAVLKMLKNAYFSADVVNNAKKRAEKFSRERMLAETIQVVKKYDRR